jgi:hypothetical protein
MQNQNQGSCSSYEGHFMWYDEQNVSDGVISQNIVWTLWTNRQVLPFTLHTAQRKDRRLAAGRCNSRLPSTLLRTLTSDEYRTDPKYVKACMQVYGDTYRPRKLSQSFRMTLSYNAATDEE